MQNKKFITKNLKFLKYFYSTKTLVLVEHNNKILSPSTFNTFSAAKKLGGKISALVVGQNINYVSGTKLSTSFRASRFERCFAYQSFHSLRRLRREYQQVE